MIDNLHLLKQIPKFDQTLKSLLNKERSLLILVTLARLKKYIDKPLLTEIETKSWNIDEGF